MPTQKKDINAIGAKMVQNFMNPLKNRTLHFNYSDDFEVVHIYQYRDSDMIYAASIGKEPEFSLSDLQVLKAIAILGYSDRESVMYYNDFQLERSDDEIDAPCFKNDSDREDKFNQIIKRLVKNGLINRINVQTLKTDGSNGQVVETVFCCTDNGLELLRAQMDVEVKRLKSMRFLKDASCLGWAASSYTFICFLDLLHRNGYDFKVVENCIQRGNYLTGNYQMTHELLIHTKTGKKIKLGFCYSYAFHDKRVNTKEEAERSFDARVQRMIQYTEYDKASNPNGYEPFLIITCMDREDFQHVARKLINSHYVTEELSQPGVVQAIEGDEDRLFRHQHFAYTSEGMLRIYEKELGSPIVISPTVQKLKENSYAISGLTLEHPLNNIFGIQTR